MVAKRGVRVSFTFDVKRVASYTNVPAYVSYGVVHVSIHYKLQLKYVEVVTYTGNPFGQSPIPLLCTKVSMEDESGMATCILYVN